jgi:hypothetical protein
MAALHSSHQVCGAARQQVIVAVHKLDVFAVGKGKAAAAGVCCAGVGLVHHTDAASSFE